MFAGLKPPVPPTPKLYFAGELEAKSSFGTNLCSSLKLAWDRKVMPTLNATCLYSFPHAFAGLNYTYDHAAFKHFGLFEMLFGVVSKNSLTGYVKLYPRARCG